MKNILQLFFICAFLLQAVASHAETPTQAEPQASSSDPGASPAQTVQGSKFLGKRLHLQTNVWYEYPDLIFSTGYHVGSILPVGTEVTVTEITDKSLRFMLTENNASFTLLNVKRANQNLSTEELAGLFFSEVDPLKGSAAFHGFTEDEKRNIGLGRIEPGMRREAVIVAYGHPLKQTPEPMNDNVWIYLDTPELKRIVLFENNRVKKVVESR